MRNPLDNKATWIILPLFLWAAVAGAFYKFFHPLSAREMQLISRVTETAKLLTAEDRERFYEAQGPLIANTDSSTFTWVSAAVAHYDKPRFKKYMQALEAALSPLTNNSASGGFGYVSSYAQLLKSAVQLSNETGNLEELAKSLIFFRMLGSGSSPYFTTVLGKDYFAALDPVVSTSITGTTRTVLERVLDEHVLTLQLRDPALREDIYYTISDKMVNLMVASSAAENGTAILSEWAGASDVTPAQTTPYWSSPAFNVRSVQRSMLSSNFWKVNTPVTVKQVVLPGSPTAAADTALLSALFMRSRESILQTLAETHGLATSLELRRAALAVVQYTEDNGRWPRDFIDLRATSYTLDNFLSKEELSQESLTETIDQRRNTSARPVGQPQLQIVTPGIDDIKSWLEIPQGWEWQQLQVAGSSNRPRWSAVIEQQNSSGGQLQQAITAGMLIRQLQNTPGCTVTSYTVSTRDTHTPLDISDAAMKQFLNLQFSNRGNTWQDRFITPTAELIQVHVDFQTQPQWLKLTVESPYANTPLASSFNRALFPFILRTAPGGSSPQDNSM